MRKIIKIIFIAFLIVTLQKANTIYAQNSNENVKADVSILNENNFARIIFKFTKIPKFQVKQNQTIITITFDRKVFFQFENKFKLPEFIEAKRIDNDNKAIRIATKDKWLLNQQIVANYLIINLLPKNSNGQMPKLPEHIVNELVKINLENQKKIQKFQNDRKNLKLNLKIGKNKNFTRIIFEWNDKVQANFEYRRNSIIVKFPEQQNAQVNKEKKTLPQYIKKIDFYRENNQLVFQIQTQEKIKSRNINDANNYIIDIAKEFRKKILTNNNNINQKPETQKIIQKNTQKNVSEKFIIPEKPYQIGRKNKHAEINTQILNLDTNNNQFDIQDKKIFAYKLPKFLPETILAKPADYKKISRKKNPNLIIPDIKRNKKDISIRFKFKKNTAAAIFKRAKKLWLVFDTDKDIATDKIILNLNKTIRNVKKITRNNNIILIFELKNDQLITAQNKKYEWILHFTNKLQTIAKPVTLEKILPDNQNLQVKINIDNHANIYELKDPYIGDNIIIITAYQPNQRNTKNRNFVDFQMFKTIHAAALKVFNDKLRVLNEGNNIIISKSNGLNISKNIAKNKNFQKNIFFQEEKDSIKTNNQKTPIKQTIKNLKQQIIEAKQSQKNTLRKKIAKIYFEQKFYTEALANLKIIRKENPNRKNILNYTPLEAKTLIRLNRIDEAQEIIKIHRPKANSELKIWQAMISAKKNDWKNAVLIFENNPGSINKLKPDLQNLFLITAAKSAIMLNDVDFAQANINKIKNKKLNKNNQAMKYFIQALIANKTNQIKKAEYYFLKAINSKIPPISTKAQFYYVKFLLEQGSITEEEALKKLQFLSVEWRGDELEIKILAEIANMKWNAKKYSEALEILKNTYQINTNSAQAKHVYKMMQKKFNSLFLDDFGEELPALEALTIYYQFKELTPVGRTGDEMISKLADKLTELDLIEQAEEILTYQVDKRLTGIAQSQSAIKLAILAIKNKNPRKALRYLQKTERIGMPENLRQKNIAIQIRTLSQINQIDQAVQMLELVNPKLAQNLYAELLWKQEKWIQAAQTYEKIIDRDFEKTDLTQQQSQTFLKMILCYSLSKDQNALSRIEAKIKQKNIKPEFQKPIDNLLNQKEIIDSRNINELAQKLASLETITNFLQLLEENLQFAQS